MVFRHLVRAYNEVRKAVSNERGQGMVEYGLLAALVAVAAITAIQLFGSEIGSVFARITTALRP